MANEKRLIDANEIEDLFYKQVEYGATDLMDAFDDALQDAQTVYAVEVVHGEWAVITDDCTFDAIYQCSVCKEEFVTNDGTPAENLWNYCPNCGAKMDGGNEDG